VKKYFVSKSDYDARLAKLAASESYYVKLGKQALHDWPTWLGKFRGGMPIGLFATIPCIESGWKMSSPGDVGLGEYGWYQIAAGTPKLFGLDPELRKDKAWNMFFAGAEYNLYAAKWLARHPSISDDTAWKLARLSFAIGDPGSKKLVAEAFAASEGAPDYESVLAYVDAGHAMKLGSQSAVKVAYRCHVVDFNWRLGKLAAPDEVSGAPVKVPTPDGRAYKFNP
jgi:hypothetical protein